MRPHSGIETTPYEKYEQGLADVNGRTVGMPFIPSDWKQLHYDILPFQKRVIQQDGIQMFNLKYNDPIIAKLRATLKPKNKAYKVRYDPRDIREVYLWDDSSSRYYFIPLKNVYYTELKINPDNPNDYPLSLKELRYFQARKKGKSPLTQRDLVEAIENRQKIIQKGRELTKTAKKARKREEKILFHKKKATSTKIRQKKIEKNETEEEQKEEKKEKKPKTKVDLEWLKKHQLPTKSRWKGRKSQSGGK